MRAREKVRKKKLLENVRKKYKTIPCGEKSNNIKYSR
jgi:hypothetical protein